MHNFFFRGAENASVVNTWLFQTWTRFNFCRKGLVKNETERNIYFATLYFKRLLSYNNEKTYKLFYPKLEKQSPKNVTIL